MKNEGGGVFFILSLFRFSQSSSAILLTPFEFPSPLRKLGEVRGVRKEK